MNQPRVCPECGYNPLITRPGKTECQIRKLEAERYSLLAMLKRHRNSTASWHYGDPLLLAETDALLAKIDQKEISK